MLFLSLRRVLKNNRRSDSLGEHAVSDESHRDFYLSNVSKWPASYRRQSDGFSVSLSDPVARGRARSLLFGGNTAQ